MFMQEHNAYEMLTIKKCNVYPSSYIRSEQLNKHIKKGVKQLASHISLI
jgi:hypothetical protein